MARLIKHSAVSTGVSQSREDYLERIYNLIQSKGYARVADIAKELNFSRPSVTIMIQQLSKDGYLNYEKYRGFTLTGKGLRIAKDIRNRHKILSAFLEQLGIDDEIAERDVEGIEHHISPQSLLKIKSLTRFLKKNNVVLD